MLGLGRKVSRRLQMNLRLILVKALTPYGGWAILRSTLLNRRAKIEHNQANEVQTNRVAKSASERVRETSPDLSVPTLQVGFFVGSTLTSQHNQPVVRNPTTRVVWGGIQRMKTARYL
jgi:hypothetical protein